MSVAGMVVVGMLRLWYLSSAKSIEPAVNRIAKVAVP